MLNRRMRIARAVASFVAFSFAAFVGACGGRNETEPVKTPLPTRQTTIDPVNKKLDTAREDAERRRQQVDDAAR